MYERLIVALIVSAALVLMIRSIMRCLRSGGNGCGSGCSGCPRAGCDDTQCKP